MQPSFCLLAAMSKHAHNAEDQDKRGAPGVSVLPSSDTKQWF